METILLIKNQIKELEQKMYSILEAEIKKEVQNIFKSQKRLVKFTDQMGVQFFTDNKGNNIDIVESYMNSHFEYKLSASFPYFQKLAELYCLIPDFCIGETLYIT